MLSRSVSSCVPSSMTPAAGSPLVWSVTLLLLYQVPVTCDLCYSKTTRASQARPSPLEQPELVNQPVGRERGVGAKSCIQITPLYTCAFYTSRGCLQDSASRTRYVCSRDAGHRGEGAAGRGAAGRQCSSLSESVGHESNEGAVGATWRPSSPRGTAAQRYFSAEAQERAAWTLGNLVHTNADNKVCPSSVWVPSSYALVAPRRVRGCAGL